MKQLLLTLILSAMTSILFAQTDAVSNQIKDDRDRELGSYRDALKKNEDEIKRLTDKLAESENAKTKDKERIGDLEKLQLELAKRTKTLEEAPKVKANFNGQLAFTELLSIQRDLQPAKLFSTSQHFFSQLGSISNLQLYNSFTNWKSEYDKWYQGQDKNDQMLGLVNNSINLISNVANKVPLYGSIVQTVSSGLGVIVSNAKNTYKDLKIRTSEMLRLLSATSQFANQKAFIDQEWEQISKELAQLQTENDVLLKSQLKFYGIEYEDYQSKYIDPTLDSERDKFKYECRNAVNKKIVALDSEESTKGTWVGQVETYMYKVQSLRIRFGNLTSRMKSNINRYQILIELFSDEQKFPAELAREIRKLSGPLSEVDKTFGLTFKPERYVEDSAVMYIVKS